MAVTPLELARLAATAADDKKATDICVLDLAETSDVCDYFVICTVSSKPQSDAVIDEIEEKLRVNCAEKPLSVEGKAGTNWVLMDYGAVIVHVMRPEARDYYRLENLWGDAPRVEMNFD